MPKINVYLPDELAEAVKEAGLPVSAICQRALEQAVRRVAAARQTLSEPLTVDGLADRFPQFAPRAREVLAIAVGRAGAGAPIGTGDLLAGMVEQGDNLAVRVLHVLEIEGGQLVGDLRARPAEAGGEPGHLTPAAAVAMEGALAEAVSMGHNYVGCEHLLPALIAEPDGVAGQVLRARGAELRLTRRTVAAALAGYVHLRANTAAADPAALLKEQLGPLVARIEQLEQRLR